MEMHTLKVKLTFQEEILGTASNNPEIHSEFIASKAQTPEAASEEVAAINVDEAIEKSMTVFPRTPEGTPILFDYQIKGFFKDAAGCLRRVPGTKSSKLKAYKKEIDGLLFVDPRKIKIVMPEGGEIGTCQRPLRASTAQGERIALASSETVPAGSFIDVEITILKDDLEDMVKECLAYGKLRGMMQWRNSGKGRFEWWQSGEIDHRPYAL